LGAQPVDVGQFQIVRPELGQHQAAPLVDDDQQDILGRRHAGRPRSERFYGRGTCSTVPPNLRRRQQVARYKIVTTGPGNTDHSLEMETLSQIGAEIVEVPGNDDDLIKAVADADAIYAKGRPRITAKV